MKVNNYFVSRGIQTLWKQADERILNSGVEASKWGMLPDYSRWVSEVEDAWTEDHRCPQSWGSQLDQAVGTRGPDPILRQQQWLRWIIAGMKWDRKRASVAVRCEEVWPVGQPHFACAHWAPVAANSQVSCRLCVSLRVWLKLCWATSETFY